MGTQPKALHPEERGVQMSMTGLERGVVNQKLEPDLKERETERESEREHSFHCSMNNINSVLI